MFCFLSQIFCLAFFLHAAAGRPVCPSIMQYRTSTTAVTRTSCDGASIGWEQLSLGGVAVAWFYCYENNAYIAVNDTTNYGSVGTRRSSFCAIRVDPILQQIDCGDLTFAETMSFGANSYGFSSSPYGFVAECNSNSGPNSAVIDLTATPFRLSGSTQFQERGSTSQTTITINAVRDYIVLTANGPQCSWVEPVTNRSAQSSSFSSFNNEPDSACTEYGWDLAFVLKTDFMSSPAPCERFVQGPSCGQPRMYPPCPPGPTQAPTPAPPTPKPTPKPTPLPTPRPSTLTLPTLPAGTTARTDATTGGNATTALPSLASTAPPPTTTSVAAMPPPTDVTSGAPVAADITQEGWFLIVVIAVPIGVCMVVVVLGVVLGRRCSKRRAKSVPAHSTPMAAVQQSAGVYGAIQLSNANPNTSYVEFATSSEPTAGIYHAPAASSEPGSDGIYHAPPSTATQDLSSFYSPPPAAM